MDVMLSLPEMIAIAHEERRDVIVRRLLLEIPEILEHYSLKGFDQLTFTSDLKAWFASVMARNTSDGMPDQLER